MLIKNLSVSFYPARQKLPNNYIYHYSKILERELTVRDRENAFRLKSLISLFWQPRVDYILINWLENILVGENGRISWFTRLKFVAFLFVITRRSSGYIVIWHNFYPHKLDERDYPKFESIEKNYHRKAALVVKNNPVGIPYGNYVPFPLMNNKEKIIFQSYETYFVVFGALLPYKKIESLIRVWSIDAPSLIIFGLEVDLEYSNRLKEQERQNVKIMPGYFSPSECDVLIGRSAGLILSQTGRNISLGSSLFYALNLGVPVIGLENGFLRWLKPHYPGGIIRVVSTHEQIVGLVEECQPPHPAVRKEVMSITEHLFGVEAVRIAWKMVFEKLAEQK